MTQIISREDARALLQSTQQLRIHWSTAIMQYVGYVIVINVGILSYFLKAYVDSSDPIYIIISANMSAIIFGAWRLYTHYIDDHIANLYPDLLLYEGILSVPPHHSTSRYLIKAVPNVGPLLNSNLTLEQKVEGISTLVKSRQIGCRGHNAFDFFTIVIIIGLLISVLSILSSVQIKSILKVIGILIGLAIVVWGMINYQKNPSKEKIDEILKEISNT